MGYLEWSLLIGWVVSLMLALAVARQVHRHMVKLDRRTRRAERLAELGTLNRGLAHEIKNPLSTIQMNLQLLREDLDPTHPSHTRMVNRLDTVLGETHRLRAITDDFQRFAGQMELDRQPVDLNAILGEIVDFFAPQAQSQGVRLRLQTDPAPLVAPVDVRLLKQAMLNLLLNGVQAMNPGGGDLMLRAERVGREAHIHVIDTGAGIPPEALPRIFEAYFSTKSRGTGLGLAITQRILAEHGGQITVNSEPGKGSDFLLRLPLD